MFWSKGQRCLCFLPALWIPPLPRSTFGVPSAQKKTPFPSSRTWPLCPNCRKPCVHWCHHRPSRCKKWYNLHNCYFLPSKARGSGRWACKASPRKKEAAGFLRRREVLPFTVCIRGQAVSSSAASRELLRTSSVFHGISHKWTDNSLAGWANMCKIYT